MNNYKWYSDSNTYGWVERFSYRGYPIRYWRRRMPRIPDEVLNCVFFLYPSVQDAQAGEKFGGTGFFVGVPSETVEGWSHIYAVTNSHVIREGASPVIRLNTTDGKIDIVGFSQDDWVHHPDGDDVAVLQWEPSERHKFKAIGTNLFLTKEKMVSASIGVGDDVYMIGRFINHEGKQKNTPSARFGNIAMMPDEPVLTQRGIHQESFVVEARSLPGYSGSPVLVYIPPFTWRMGQTFTNVTREFFLGLDWGHSHTKESVRDREGKPLEEKWHVRSNSGMMNVVPAWRLYDLLNLEEFVMYRKEEDKKLAEQAKASSAEFDTETESESFTKNDFETALKKVSLPKSDKPKDSKSASKKS